MARIKPLGQEDLSEYAGLQQIAEATMGFVPSSLATMARVEGLLPAFGQLVGVVQHGGTVPAELKLLVSYVTSRAAGCRYCQAHTAAHAAHAGVDEDKITAVWEFEQSPLFSDAERAALRLAVAGGLSPVQATDEHFVELRKHFTDAEICEIVAVIALFGYLNRWNDIIGTTLEDKPLAFAEEHLRPDGWNVGHHGA